ncbi:LOW QUALITY PROTEIN: uncharacterized protein LOC142365467 [Opisthocomus hoazin]|uniref:LOW QUALITY PROTEIN: uncharacterized protein LOC142365467 n=1 Tax=Opisthocomus hoazin TaxID=30419 RepID=UPI003F531979
MAAQQAADTCDCVSVRAEETERLYDFLEVHRARPSLQGQGWARDHWFRLQSVVDRMKVLQKEARVKRGKGKAIICAVLGASLAAAVEERNQRGDLKGAKETAGSSPPHMYPLVKTEYVYEDDGDNCPQVITKEIPFAATKLAKLRKDFARTARESETEYVWRVSLSGGDGILLSEREAEGYWGPGVFLTTGDRRAPWSLTQRAAYWAGGLNLLERGDPLAVTGTTDQLLESVQKAACLQMMYDRELKPNLSSPMLLPADPERMTPLIRGLPDSLKPIGIQLQGRIQNTPSEERIAAALEGGATPDRRWPGRKVWTWGEIAQELINYGRKYGPVNRPYSRAETRAVRAAERVTKQSSFSGRSPDLAGKEKPLNRQRIWQLGLQKGIPRDLMDGLPTKKLGQLVQRWSGREIAFGPGPSAPPLVDLGGGTK